MNTEICERVILVIARMQKIDASDIEATSDLEEMGMDSFDAISLLFALEEEFNIEIPGNSINYRRVDEIARAIESVLSDALVA